MSKFWDEVDKNTRKQARDFINRLKLGKVIWVRRWKVCSKDVVCMDLRLER